MKDSNQQQPSQQWQGLQAKFETLCDEQERIYNPQFEAIFAALFDIDEGQRAVYNTSGWNMGQPLPDKADEALITQAINKAGYAKKKAIAEGFLRYANTVIEGKRLQAEMATQNIKELAPPQPPVVAGWVFKPATILAPVELHDTINKAVDDAALKGMFDCITDMADAGIDELLDELLMAEAFNVPCSLTHYTEELRKYNVILGQHAFFDRDCTLLLLATLKEAVLSLKENTDHPNRLKKAIADIVKRFDDVKVWGIFFQILILQGLCDMLERLDINEGESGFDEAQAFYNWAFEMLVEKEYWYACVSSMTYSDGDLLRLKPLCAYLMNTTAGQLVQRHLTQKPQQQDIGGSTGQPLTKHFGCNRTDDTLELILEALKTADRRNKPYLPADTTAAAWLYVCKGTQTNKPVTPLNWLGSQNELALLVEKLFGSYWETAKACFRIEGKEPNVKSMTNDRSKIKSGRKNEPKKHKRLLNILNIGSMAGKK